MRVWETSHLLDTLPTGKTASEHVYDFTDSQANLEKIQLHFKQLKTRLVLGLVLGFLLPNALLSAYFHFQFAHTLKRFDEAFIDVGFLASDGIEIGYTGPFPTFPQISLIVISLIISIVIYYTINKLVENARQMAEKGQQLQEMLAHASKLASIGELAAGVAHEINNPLAIIMATSGVIRDMLNPEFELDHSSTAINSELTIIDNAATRAKGITKKLQDMGKSSVSCSVACDINALLDDVLNRLKKTEFKSKSIEVVTHFSTLLPSIMAEADPLRQVFGNILINASDAIFEQGTISVSTETNEGMVSVTINDTGKGIPPDDLKRIFNPFFTTKGGGKGTGLGLSIAASIVKYCGGTIKVNSIRGVGSSFTVQLPLN